MPDNLGSMIQCESHVNTRLRYVLKSVVTLGSLKREETVQVLYEQSVSVNSASTNLNAPNGASSMNDTESGVGYLPKKEKESVVNAG